MMKPLQRQTAISVLEMSISKRVLISNKYIEEKYPTYKKKLTNIPPVFSNRFEVLVNDIIEDDDKYGVVWLFQKIMEIYKGISPSNFVPSYWEHEIRFNEIIEKLIACIDTPSGKKGIVG